MTTTIADWSGRLVPRSHNHVVFSVDGPGEIIAVDNGDATSFEPFTAKEHDAYNGLCLAVIRSTGKPGQIVVKASSSGLHEAQAKITAKSAR